MSLSTALFGTLRGRLILSVALVHALLMSVFIVDMGRRQRTSILHSQVQAATAVARSLATSAATWLATDDLAGLQELVDNQGVYPELVFAILVDEYGRILAHTDRSRRGQFLLDLPGGPSQVVLSRTPQLVDVMAPARLGGRCVGWARVGLCQQESTRMLSALVWDGVFYASIAIGLGSLLAWLLARHVTRRLYTVQGTMAAIKAGQREARTRLAGADEAAGVAREFDALLDTLAEREADLRASEEDLALTLRSIGDGVITCDVSGRIRRMNPMAETLTGWPLVEAVGRPLAEVFRLLLVEGREPVAGPLKTFDLSGQVLLVARDGQERRIVDSLAPIRDGRGETRGLVLVFHDITDKQRLEEELRQSQKQQIIGQLAGGIAHDFNNMLAVIFGSADLISQASGTVPAVAKPLRMLTDAASRAADLTAKLLGFARRGKMRHVPVDLHQEIATVEAILRRTIDRQITIVSDLAAGQAQLLGDPAQIQNLLLNLCINARDAMPHGGSLTLATSLVPADAAELRTKGLPAVVHVALIVSDTGVGIPDWVMARLFEPFVTTKEKGKGTGLGLASVQGTVRDHCGAISVETQPGTGTTFRILLPITPVAVVEPTPAGPAPVDLHGQTILIADDEDLVRGMLAAQLTDAGATVVAAVDGQQAVELFSAEPDRFTLVILDQVMPRLNGISAFRVMHALRPATRILLSSGFVGEQAMDTEVSGLAGFLAKPYTRAELLRQVCDLGAQASACRGHAKAPQPAG